MTEQIRTEKKPDTDNNAATTATGGNKAEGWGIEKIPYPEGFAHIKPRHDLCVGCGICEMACSMNHYGVINRRLSRIKIQKYLLPLPKSIPSVCAQCQPKEERACEKACPQTPKAIYCDEKTQHITVDKERCLGSTCNLCAKACKADVIHYYPPEHNYAIVCDLCEKNGKRRPSCVEACPTNALEYMPALGVTLTSVKTPPYFLSSPSYYSRVHPDENAKLWAKRLKQIPKDKVGPW